MIHIYIYIRFLAATARAMGVYRGRSHDEPIECAPFPPEERPPSPLMDSRRLRKKPPIPTLTQLAEGYVSIGFNELSLLRGVKNVNGSSIFLQLQG